MIQVFSKEWFELHQKKLLWLANTKLGRYILRIHGERSSVGKNKILAIIPNAIAWEEDGKYKAEFRTHEKFGKRLYYAFKPLWMMFHAWDMVIANRFKPQWNLGFDSFGPVYPSAGTTSPVDGYVAYSSSVSWAATRNAATGNASSATGTTLIVNGRRTAGTTYVINRSAVCFDTSDLTAAAVVSDATVSLNGVSITIPAAWSWRLVSVALASTDNVVVADYDQFGTTALASDYSSGDYVDEGYNDMNLNAAGRSAISLTGISQFGIRNLSQDIGDVAPGVSEDYVVNFDSADAVGTTTDPKMVATFTLSSGVSTLMTMGIG